MKLWKMLALMVAVLGLAFAPMACSDDDENDDGSEGEAEAEAEGEGSCEADSADCTACRTCAEGEDPTAPCFEFALACLPGTDCQLILSCIETCSDQACADTCVADNPDGEADFKALAECEICDECPSDCADYFYTCGG